MIAYLSGKILEKQANGVILDVNGCGFFLNCSLTTMDALKAKGDTESLFCQMAVKEDAIDLYGFKNVDEKQMFLNLLTVTGIGNKSAMQILSSMNYQDIATCIINADAETLIRNKACGRKTAERLILELKNKSFDFAVKTQKPEFKTTNSIILQEAIDALISLGLNRHEAESSAKRACTGNETKTEEIVKKALSSF